MNNNEKQKEFARLYLTGKFTQRKLAEQLGVSAVTANEWAKNMQSLKYFAIRKDLTKALETIPKQPYTKETADLISQLITDIERLDKLIIKAKYMPHLTSK